jgi:uncharacterized protein YqgV (UPF0045/DUF77 family)
MNVTLEISMYPLREDYEEQILSFLSEIHKESGLEIRVNALSTQVQGDFDETFSTVQSAIKKVYQQGVKATFVVKILRGEIDLAYDHDA